MRLYLPALCLVCPTGLVRSIPSGKSFSRLQKNMQANVENIQFADLALVEQCRRGDPEAMDRLIVRYQDRIYNVILRICGNSDDAAELTQDTFVKVIENIGSFQGRSSLYTWLFRIAVNLALNYCSRRTKLGFVSLDDEDYSGSGRVAATKALFADEASLEPLEAVKKKELCELVVAALGRLEPAQRAVIVLRDIEGMDYAQIAQALNIELGTVKSRLSRARNALRERLAVVLK
jgi:RNA polymerase sigma-70 factor (ECF subfamily)